MSGLETDWADKLADTIYDEMGHVSGSDDCAVIAKHLRELRERESGRFRLDVSIGPHTDGRMKFTVGVVPWDECNGELNVQNVRRTEEVYSPSVVHGTQSFGGPVLSFRCTGCQAVHAPYMTFCPACGSRVAKMGLVDDR